MFGSRKSSKKSYEYYARQIDREIGFEDCVYNYNREKFENRAFLTAISVITALQVAAYTAFIPPVGRAEAKALNAGERAVVSTATRATDTVQRFFTKSAKTPSP